MERRRRQIEREFGVPIAGEILDPSLWTKTSLKQLPQERRLKWSELFGRTAPIVLDLGCGNGRFLLGSAVWRPAHDHLGIDVLPLVIRYATRRANQRGLANIRFTVAEARQFLMRYVEAGSVSEIHCYHPQPYHDADQIHRRLVTPEFLALVHQSLVPGGQFFIQTDSSDYWQHLLQILPIFFDFEERPSPWPDAPKGRTRREIIALRRGLPVFRGSGTARVGLDEAEAVQRASSVPQQDFKPDGRLTELDEIERE